MRAVITIVRRQFSPEGLELKRKRYLQTKLKTFFVEM